MKNIRFSSFFCISVFGAVLALFGASLCFAQVVRTSLRDAAAHDIAVVQRANASQASVDCPWFVTGDTVQANCIVPYTVGGNGAMQFTVNLQAPGVLHIPAGGIYNPVVALAVSDNAPSPVPVVAALNLSEWLLLTPDTVIVVGTVVNLSTRLHTGYVHVHASMVAQTTTAAVAPAAVE